MKKSHIIIIFLLGLIVSMSMIKGIVYNRLSTSGVFVGRVEDEIVYYKTQNAKLLEELLISTSLINIASKATEAGFVNDDSLMVLKTSNSLAVKQ